MTAAMLIALLLQSGTCSQTQFQGEGGMTLTVVVCPVLNPPEGAEPEEEEPEALPPGKRQRS